MFYRHNYYLSASCLRVDRYSTLFSLITKALQTLFILIGLQQPSEKCFSPIHIPKLLLKTPSYGPVIEIDSFGPSREYTGWQNIVDTLDFMNLSTMDFPVLPRALYNVMANNVYKLSMTNESGEIPFPTLLLLFPGRTNFYAKLTPVPDAIVLFRGFILLYGIGGT